MRLSELTKSLDRSQFACGNEALDDYFHKFVGQDVRNGLAKCYVALADVSDTILGYFTLSCWALDQRLLPEDKRRGRYLHLPVALLGRLAVSTSHQGLGIASALVEKALDITQTMPVGCAGLIVEPKPGLERFYERLQFHGLRDSEGRTFFVKLHGKKRIS